MLRGKKEEMGGPAQENEARTAGTTTQGTSYWTEHKGQSQTRPSERVYPEGFKGQMYPAGAAANHPAAATLRQWATKGCPVETGPAWTEE